MYLASWRTTPVAVKVLLVPGTAGANLATPGAAQEALALPPSALPELEAEAGLLASLRWAAGCRGLFMLLLAAAGCYLTSDLHQPARPGVTGAHLVPFTPLQAPLLRLLLRPDAQPASAGHRILLPGLGGGAAGQGAR